MGTQKTQMNTGVFLLFLSSLNIDILEYPPVYIFSENPKTPW